MSIALTCRRAPLGLHGSKFLLLAGFLAVSVRLARGSETPTLIERPNAESGPTQISVAIWFVDLCRYQVANCYMGRAGLINSGGASGKNDFGEAVVTAVINKRAGGTGLISGRKAFQRPMKEGIELLNVSVTFASGAQPADSASTVQRKSRS